MIRLGLTGSIGMGKSTTAAMFTAQNVPVYDADAAVHALYAPGGGGAEALADAFPSAVIDGAVDRAVLSALVLNDPAAFQRLESLIHPLLGRARAQFFATFAGAPLVVFDIPLLFETGGPEAFDGVVVVTCPPELQRRRVLERPGMTEAKFEAILRRQVPDEEKRRRADFVVQTGEGLEAARATVRAIIETVQAPGWRRAGA